MSVSNHAPAAGPNNKRKGLSDFFQFDDETILWSASLMLLKHLQKQEHRQHLQGKRVLELGSGLGHLGLGLHRLGAHVTCTERPKELPALQASIAAQQHATGGILDSALALLGHAAVGQQSTTGQASSTSQAESGSQSQGADVPGSSTTNHLQSRNGLAEVQETDDQGQQGPGSIQAVALEWGQEGFERSPLSTQQLPPFDFIICSELLYIERLFPELLWTLKRFAGPRTVVWSIFIDRPFSFMFFSLLSDEGCWDVEAITDFDDLGLDSELQVHLHRITLNKGGES